LLPVKEKTTKTATIKHSSSTDKDEDADANASANANIEKQIWKRHSYPAIHHAYLKTTSVSFSTGVSLGL
jgi:hypothetical protein